MKVEEGPDQKRKDVMGSGRGTGAHNPRGYDRNTFLVCIQTPKMYRNAKL